MCFIEKLLAKNFTDGILYVGLFEVLLRTNILGEHLIILHRGAGCHAPT